ncbi:MAG: hypothetical protein EOP49_34240, partial [Sphingobacteriales bacterium]
MALNQPLEEVSTPKNDGSMENVVLEVKKIIRYLRSKWLWIAIIAVVGGAAGFAYSRSVTPLYTAECNFVLDESSGSGGGSLSALGIGFGGKGGDFFAETDNIIWLYSTRLMLQRALLSSVQKEGKKVLLVDWLIDESGMRKGMAKTPKAKQVTFLENQSDSTMTRDQNALMGSCVGLIKGKYLKVALVPKTENVITVSIKSREELFAKALTEVLVAKVNSYYIQTKTKKSAEEVALLEEKVAQYYGKMSSNIYEVASGYDDAPYANPNRQVLKVAPQRKQVDAQLSGQIYGNLVQQLELSRTDLQKQMPLIQ